MGRHRVSKEGRIRSGLFGRRRVRDDLFERSFRTCAGCGEDVYVLAEGCRECGKAEFAHAHRPAGGGWFEPAPTGLPVGMNT